MSTPRDLEAAPSEPQESSNMDAVQEPDAEFIENLPLYRALQMGDREEVKNFLFDNLGALRANLTTQGNKPLHIAVTVGNVNIVTDLVDWLRPEDLELKNDKESTAMIYAAVGGITEIAELLHRKNGNLITIPNIDGVIPVVTASLYGNKEMVRYLYSKTPKQELSPEEGKNGASLLTYCIMGEIFDVALDLLKHHQRLAFDQDKDNDTAYNVLAQTPSAFPSGSTLTYWQRLTYKLINIHPPPCSLNPNRDIERLHNGSTSRRNMIAQGLHKLMEIFWRHLKNLFPIIQHIYDLKLTHAQAKELLCCICKEASTLPPVEFKKIGEIGVYNAVNHGIVEFVEEMIKLYPHLIWIRDSNYGNIFLYATAQRQEKIFSLIYHMGAKKSTLLKHWDKNKNNILHQAALLAPSSQLDRVSGPALQMQRELQWFKEVERIVPPKFKEMVNSKERRTPRALFTEKHKELKEKAEKWMKKTAQHSIVVAALIVTVMFAAVLDVPRDKEGIERLPLVLNRQSLVVFIVSDGMSLLASSTSLLMFLGILTSQYKEEDFLTSLPTKLLIGLSTLFFSIPTMMINFGTTVLLLEGMSPVSFLIIFGCLFGTIFSLQYFPLIVEILKSTYGPGIFDKPKKRWWFLPPNNN